MLWSLVVLCLEHWDIEVYIVQYYGTYWHVTRSKVSMTPEQSENFERVPVVHIVHITSISTFIFRQARTWNFITSVNVLHKLLYFYGAVMLFWKLVGFLFGDSICICLYLFYGYWVRVNWWFALRKLLGWMMTWIWTKHNTEWECRSEVLILVVVCRFLIKPETARHINGHSGSMHIFFCTFFL